MAFAAVIGGTAFGVKSLSGKAGYSKAPGESSCTSCHNGTANSGIGSIYMTSSMTNFQYVPGMMYTINVVIKYTGRSHYGMDVEALNSANASVGTITCTNTAYTQKQTSSNGRVNLTHKSGGIVHADSAVYSFNWTAPATNVGNVTFYYCGVAANNNGSESGDNVYYGNHVVTPSTVGIEENTPLASGLDVHANAANHSIAISFDATQAATTQVMVFDLTGKVVAELNAGKTNAGKVNLNIDLPGNINNGIYIVNVLNGGQQLSKKAALVF
jgi:hypothetical protein